MSNLMNLRLSSEKWVEVEFQDFFDVLPTNIKVKSDKYKKSGRWPIVDQGQKLISGYSDQETHFENPPYIVFGDHTRCVKWVNFKFLAGADGVKLLKAKEGIDDKFAFYTLQNTAIENLGYSRHMRELKNKTFRYPIDIESQQKIASCLSTWDAAIEAVEEQIELAAKKKKALMQKLLTGEVRLPGFDGGWETSTLEELETKQFIWLGRGKVISKKDITATPGDFPIYSSSVKNYGLMGSYGSYDFEEELITWSIDGGGHFFYRPPHRFSITNVSGYIKVNSEFMNCMFLSEVLKKLHSRIKFDYQHKAHPSVIKKLYTISYPSVKEQNEIAKILSSFSSRELMLDMKLKNLKEQKKALMQQLLGGNG